MPTYSYACPSCDHAFDIRQSFTDDPLTMCPKCGEPKLRKVIHAVGISFKGSGFYRNDSKASASSARSKGGSAASSGGSTTASESSSSPAPAKESSASTVGASSSTS